jgi:hypothetical protein
MNFKKDDTVWWQDPNRTGIQEKFERACWVKSVNEKTDTVLIEYFEDPTAERITKVAIVSPRVLRERMIPS